MSEDTPASNNSNRSSEDRRNQCRRNLFPDDASPVQSPQWDQSPGLDNDVFNEAMLLEEVNFDPEATAAALFNQIDEQQIIQFDFINDDNEDTIILEPVEEPAVPIEDEPIDAQSLTFTITITNNNFKSDEDELEEILEDQINAIEEAMSPPDYSSFVPLQEE